MVMAFVIISPRFFDSFGHHSISSDFTKLGSDIGVMVRMRALCQLRVTHMWNGKQGDQPRMWMCANLQLGLISR
jgi:hypothetical protein